MKTADKKGVGTEKTQSRHTVITRAGCRFSYEIAANRHIGDTLRVPLLAVGCMTQRNVGELNVVIDQEKKNIALALCVVVFL